MGGFQKYPIPRYLHVQAWVLNKNWKRNIFHTLIPVAIFNLMIYRNVSVSTYRSPRYGYYVDPESDDAPKLLNLE